jgi:signal transduction histidine kinase
MAGVLLKDKPDVEFVVDMPAPLPQMTSDHDKLRQILINLLANATKFTQRGSVVLRARHEDAAIVFSVEDTGIGVSPEYLDRLFEPFFQVTQIKRQTLSGTGLGLAIAKTLTTLLGGNLTVASVIGQGTIFTLKLPRVHSNNDVPDTCEQHDNATPAPHQEIGIC